MPSHLLQARLCLVVFPTLCLFRFAIIVFVFSAGLAYGQAPSIMDLSSPDLPHVMRIYGASPGEQLGSEGPDGIAFGDINGDGYDDLIIGAPQATLPTRDLAGTAYIIYGSPDLEGSQVDLAHLPSGYQGTTFIGKTYSNLGYAVSCGDIDQDGCDDVLLGAPNEKKYETGPSFGLVHVFYGGPHLVGRVVDLVSPPVNVRHTTLSGSLRVLPQEDLLVAET